jgi:hypothetical protein
MFICCSRWSWRTSVCFRNWKTLRAVTTGNRRNQRGLSTLYPRDRRTMPMLQSLPERRLVMHTIRWRSCRREEVVENEEEWISKRLRTVWKRRTRFWERCVKDLLKTNVRCMQRRTLHFLGNVRSLSCHKMLLLRLQHWIVYKSTHELS